MGWLGLRFCSSERVAKVVGAGILGGGGVEHPAEVKAVGFGAEGAAGPGGVFEELLDPVEGRLALGDADEAADEDSDHSEEEAVAFEAQGEQGSVGLDGDAAEGSDGVDFVGVAFCGEGGEVVGALEELSGGAQQGLVDGKGDVPSAVAFRGTEDTIVPDAVGVDFSGGAESCVEGARGFGAVEDAECGDQACVEGAGPLFEGQPVGGHVGVGNLAGGMDAGIGAPGAVDDDSVADEVGEGAFDGVLDGASVALALPAVEGGAVVGDEHPQPQVAFGRRIEAALGRVHARGPWKLCESSQLWRMS